MTEAMGVVYTTPMPYVISNSTVAVEFESNFAKYILPVVSCFITFGIGCGIDYRIVLHHLKKPIAISVGMFCQYFTMPVIGLCVTYMFGISRLVSIGVLLVSCSPGGMVSNAVTYWLDGDLSLSILFSVAMTFVSTTLAMGFIPLWLFIFKVILQLEQEFSMPFGSIVMSIVLLMVPSLFGIIVNAKYPKTAAVLTKVCSGLGLVIAFISVIITLVNIELDIVFRPKIIAASAVQSLLGLILAYLITMFPCFHLEHTERIAIAIECMVQNVVVAFTIFMLSFSSRLDILRPNILTPLIYGLTLLAESFLIIAIYRTYIRFYMSSKKKEDSYLKDEVEKPLHIT